MTSVLEADLEKALGGPVDKNVTLAQRTSVRVGGAADFFATVGSAETLARALAVCADHDAAWHVLGLGSNTLVSDQGVRGVVFRLSQSLAPEAVAAEGEGRFSFTLGAGQALSRLVSRARERRCVGMEYLGGIPGTVGGAVVMNAGTKHGSLENVCAEVGLVEPGRVRRLRADEVGFGYRSSKLPERSAITWARFVLPVGDDVAVLRSRKVLEDDMTRRRQTQPYDLPSFGSTFKNPPGDWAARLIEACGLKGKRQGGAQVSELHANFIVNRGGATAADIVELMRAMFEAVRERFGVALQPEVKLLGDFDAEGLPWGAAMRSTRAR